MKVSSDNVRVFTQELRLWGNRQLKAGIKPNVEPELVAIARKNFHASNNLLFGSASEPFERSFGVDFGVSADLQ